MNDAMMEMLSKEDEISVRRMMSEVIATYDYFKRRGYSEYEARNKAIQEMIDAIAKVKVPV